MIISSDRKNSTWLAVQFIVTLVASLVILKLNIQSFGKEVFGIWIVLASIWGFSSTLDFGFGTAIVKYVAQYRDEPETLNRIASTIFFVFVFFGLLLLILGNIAAFLFYFINRNIIPANQVREFKLAFFILGAAFLLQYMSIYFRSILEGLNAFVVTSAIAISQYMLIMVGVIILFFTRLPIIWLSLIYLITYAIIFLVYLLYFTNRISFLKIKFSAFDLKEIKRVIRFSFAVQLTNLFYALIDPIVKYIIGSVYNVSTVSAYEIARRFAIAISGLFFNTFKIILPKASSLKTPEEVALFINKEILEYSKLGIIYSGIAFGVLLFPIMLAMNCIFGIREALIIFLILALPESINNFGYAIYNFLLGRGKARLLALIQFNNLIFVVLGLYIGFWIFSNVFGLIGYFVSVVLANLLMIFYLSKRWAFSVRLVWNQCRIDKLILLILILSITTVILYYNWIPFVLLFTATSILSLIIFFTDVKELSNKLLYRREVTIN